MARDEDDAPEHPATKGFNGTGFKLKYSLGRLAKFAAIGAAIAGGIGLIGLALSGPLGLAAIGTASLFGFAGVTITTVLAAGAALGGMFGLLTGDADGAKQEEMQRLEENYDRSEARRDRMDALAMRRDQQKMAYARHAQSLGLNPNAGLPRGRGGHELG